MTPSSTSSAIEYYDRAHQHEDMTMQKLEQEREAEQSEVLELLERRTTVQQWLARLDEHRGDVNDRVLEKVRRDYEERLQKTLDALASHRESVQGELERTTESLTAAEKARQDAADELEETRLRNLIGEINPESWQSREPELDQALRAAEANETAIRTESERLRDLLSQLEERAPENGADDFTFSLEAPEGTESEAPVDDVTVDDVTVENPATPLATDAAEEPRLEADDETIVPPHGDVLDTEATSGSAEPFLDQLERAVAQASEENGRSPEASDEQESEGEEDEDTAPKPGLKCAECGYTNDLSAWFCGVCGADVG